jgi:ABC-type nickel/cobalt efflux system permease component RcnA
MVITQWKPGDAKVADDICSFRGVNQCFAKKRDKLCVDMPIVCDRYVIRILSSSCPGLVLVAELAAQLLLIGCGHWIKQSRWKLAHSSHYSPRRLSDFISQQQHFAVHTHTFTKNQYKKKRYPHRTNFQPTHNEVPLILQPDYQPAVQLIFLIFCGFEISNGFPDRHSHTTHHHHHHDRPPPTNPTNRHVFYHTKF